MGKGNCPCYYPLVVVGKATIVSLLWFSATVHAFNVDWKSLDEGQVIADSIEDEQGIPGVRALFLVKAKREDIWATLVDYENFPRIFKGIDSMKVLESHDSGARVEFWADIVVMKLNYVLYRNYEKPGHKLTWRRVSGDMKDIHGSWHILDARDTESKLVVYESFVDTGFSVVTWSVRLAARRKAKEMAYRLRDWIERGE